MITKLKLKNFKNFKQEEIELGPVSVLVGANATGKSNIRDALRFLHGIARGYNLAEILGEKYGEGGYLQWSGIRGGTRAVCLSGEDSFGLSVEFERKANTQGSEVAFKYDIQVQCLTNGKAPRVLRESLYKNDHRIFAGPFQDNNGPIGPKIIDANYLEVEVELRAEEETDSKMGPPGWNKISMMRGISIQPMLTQILEWAKHQNVVPQMALEIEETLSEFESIRFIDLSPESMRKPSLPGQYVLSDRGENLSSVLQAICEQPQLKQALSNWIQELTPMDVVDFEFVPDAAGKILVYLIEAGGRKTSANSASDGTLRFLGMLAALLGPNPAKFYFLEEIDNGIHPTRLALLMDLLDQQSKSKGIQIVASTHSPQVLRLIKPDNLKYATLAYRLKGSADGRLKPLTEIPHLLDVIKNQDIARLHESSWMENTMEFSEGSPKTFPIEAEERAQ